MSVTHCHMLCGSPPLCIPPCLCAAGRGYPGTLGTETPWGPLLGRQSTRVLQTESSCFFFYIMQNPHTRDRKTTFWVSPEVLKARLKLLQLLLVGLGWAHLPALRSHSQAHAHRALCVVCGMHGTLAQMLTVTSH